MSEGAWNGPDFGPLSSPVSASIRSMAVPRLRVIHWVGWIVVTVLAGAAAKLMQGLDYPNGGVGWGAFRLLYFAPYVSVAAMVIYLVLGLVFRHLCRKTDALAMDLTIAEEGILRHSPHGDHAVVPWEMVEDIVLHDESFELQGRGIETTHLPRGWLLEHGQHTSICRLLKRKVPRATLWLRFRCP